VDALVVTLSQEQPSGGRVGLLKMFRWKARADSPVHMRIVETIGLNDVRKPTNR
jgi:hypothetical protein